MTTGYLHGVEIIETSQKPTIESVNESIIGLVGTVSGKNKKPDGTKVKLEKQITDKLYQVSSLAEFDTLFPINDYEQTGIRAILVDIYSQTNAQVVVSIMNDKDDLKVAFKRLEEANNQLKLIPKIIIAPEIIDYKLVNTDIKTLLETVDKLAGIFIIDVNKKTNDELSSGYETILSKNPRLYPVYPRVKIKKLVAQNSSVSDTSLIDSEFSAKKIESSQPSTMITETIRPASSFVAGLMVKSDKERGFWHSPSNYLFSNIEGLSENIDFSLGDDKCTANKLNAAKINTIIWQDGYRLWGNRSYSELNDGFAFISARRIADVLNESIAKAHSWALDQNITKNFKDTIIDSVNTYMRSLKMQGAIIDGKCYADKNKNTPENLAKGQFHFCFDFTPPYPAERITFQSILTNDYLKEVL